MLIKFKAPDPRAGTTVQMDSSRGQHFIDAGSAVAVSESDRATALTEPHTQAPAAKRASKATPNK